MEIGSRVNTRNHGYGILKSKGLGYSNCLKVLLDSTGRFVYLNYLDILDYQEDVNPKFKVGDRVKIDWENCEFYQYEDFRGDGEVYRVDNKVRVNHFSIENPSWSIEYSPEDASKYLTIVESKPKCKFKVGDIVEANLISLGWKIPKCPEKEAAMITEIDGTSIHIELLRYKEYQASFYIDDAKQYIKYPENKPKWSVGTYVEFTSNYEAMYNGNLYGWDKGESYKICKFGAKILLETEKSDWYYSLDNTESLSTMESMGVIKWHENKPEEKEIPNNRKLQDEWFTEQFEKLWGVHEPKVRYPDPVEMKYPLAYMSRGIWQNIEDMYEEHIKQGIYYNGFFSPPSILQKPTITISKQKSINININKPII